MKHNTQTGVSKFFKNWLHSTNNVVVYLDYTIYDETMLDLLIYSSRYRVEV